MRFGALDAGEAEGGVAGERGLTAVFSERSLRSRLTALLAAALVGAVGLAMLGWYYSNLMSRLHSSGSGGPGHAPMRAAGGLPLPPLGRVDPPGLAAAAPASGDGTVASLGAAPVKDPPVLERRFTGEPVSRFGSDAGRPLARQLTEHLFGRSQDGLTAVPPPERAQTEAPRAGNGVQDPIAPPRPHLLPSRQFLLSRGAFVDCTLETAIDSTLPGMTTCVTATDTFSADGSVVLLEKGTKLIGETRGQVQQGTARLYVLWSEARTPAGVAVPLDSPGTDSLGRSGLSGEIDRHFWDRFGAAILITTIDGVVQAAVQRGDRGGGTIIYNPAPAEGVATETLKSTLSISPTVSIPQGSRIQVFVARDVDFRQVYELRITTARP